MMLRCLFILSIVFVAINAMGAPPADCSESVQCPKGYKLQKRKNGPWCNKFIPGNLTWWEAERECRCTTKGATLSGIETSSEKKWLEEETQNLLDKEKIQNGAVWIGAYRRKVCPSGEQDKWSKNALCSDEKMFQFTDRHSCGTFIFQDWADKFPTSAAGDNCGVIVVSTESSGANADMSGKAADKNCESVTGPSPILNSIGFVCGVKPIQGGNGGYSGGGGGYSGGGEAIIIGAGKPTKKQ